MMKLSTKQGIEVTTLVYIKLHNLEKEGNPVVKCSPQEYLDTSILYERLSQQDKSELEEHEIMIRNILDIIINKKTTDKDLINRCKVIVDISLQLDCEE